MRSSIRLFIKECIGGFIGLLVSFGLNLVDTGSINPLEWTLKGWGVSLISTILGAIIGNMQATISEFKETIKSKCPAYSESTNIHACIDTLIKRRMSYLSRSDDLLNKIRSPFQVFIKEEILQNLNLFLEKINNKRLNPVSGMIWIVPNIDIKGYASIALALDKKIIKKPDSTIYSTNIIPPTDFSHDEVITHLTVLNGLAGETIEDKKTGNLKPRLLRIQLVNLGRANLKIKILPEEKYEPDKEKDMFLELLCSEKEEYSKKYSDYKNYYITYSTFLVTPEALGCGVENILGDYILYDDSLVLKWDETTHTLYLMFGEEIVNSHRKIFESISKEYNNLKDKTEGNVINLQAYLDKKKKKNNNG